MYVVMGHCVSQSIEQSLLMTYYIIWRQLDVGLIL